MDKLDEQILNILKINSRITFVEIANRLNISEGAVRFRIKKMVDTDFLRFTIDYKREIKAIVMIKVAVKTPTTKIANLIKNFGINSVYEVSGKQDIICFIESNEIKNINSTVERIRKIPDIIDTDTFLVLK